MSTQTDDVWNAVDELVEEVSMIEEEYSTCQDDDDNTVESGSDSVENDDVNNDSNDVNNDLDMPDEVFSNGCYTPSVVNDACDASDEVKKDDAYDAPNKIADEVVEVKVVSRDPIYDYIDELFADMAKKKFCFDNMNRVAERGAELEKEQFIISMDLFKTAADCLLMSTLEVDVRIRINYMRTFRVLFLSVDKYNDAMRYFYSLEFRNEASDVTLPQLHTYVDKFEESLIDLLRDLSKLDFPHKNYKKIKQLAFLLMISPRATLRLVFMGYVCNKFDMSPSYVTRAFRLIPAFCELRYGMSNIPNHSRSMITALVYRFFFAFGKAERGKRDVDFDDSEHYIRLLRLLSYFTSTRTDVTNGKLMCRSPFDANDLIVDFICPQILPEMPHNHITFVFAIDLFTRLLTPCIFESRDNIKKKDEAIICWKFADKNSEIAVDLGVILHHLSNICMTTTDASIKLKCFKLVERLYGIFKNILNVESTKDVELSNVHSNPSFRLGSGNSTNGHHYNQHNDVNNEPIIQTNFSKPVNNFQQRQSNRYNWKFYSEGDQNRDSTPPITRNESSSRTTRFSRSPGWRRAHQEVQQAHQDVSRLQSAHQKDRQLIQRGRKEDRQPMQHVHQEDVQLMYSRQENPQPLQQGQQGASQLQNANQKDRRPTHRGLKENRQPMQHVHQEDVQSMQHSRQENHQPLQGAHQRDLQSMQFARKEYGQPMPYVHREDRQPVQHVQQDGDQPMQHAHQENREPLQQGCQLQSPHKKNQQNRGRKRATMKLKK